MIKPQHRMVLGLISMSAGAYLLTVMLSEEDDEDTPLTDVLEDTPRLELPLPTERAPPAGTATDAAISTAVATAQSTVARCAHDHRRTLGTRAAGPHRLRVTLTHTGLHHIELLDQPEAPLAFTGCLATGLSDQPWPATTGDDSVRITVAVDRVTLR